MPFFTHVRECKRLERELHEHVHKVAVAQQRAAHVLLHLQCRSIVFVLVIVKHEVN